MYNVSLCTTLPYYKILFQRTIDLSCVANKNPFFWRDSENPINVKIMLMHVFSGTIYKRRLKFSEVKYESFKCDLTQRFFKFMVSINRSLWYQFLLYHERSSDILDNNEQGWIMRGVHKVSFPLVQQLSNHLLREVTACTWWNDVTWRMHKRDFLGSHSIIVAAVEDWCSYSKHPSTVMCGLW